RTDRYTTFAAGDQDWSEFIAWYDRSGAPMRLEVWYDAADRVLQMVRRPPVPGAGMALVVVNGSLQDAPVQLAAQSPVHLAWDSAWERPAECGPELDPGSEVQVQALSMQIYLSESTAESLPPVA